MRRWQEKKRLAKAQWESYQNRRRQDKQYASLNTPHPRKK
jgi:hypothetical protein